MLWKTKKDQQKFYRVRIDGWLYVHSDDTLTTDATKAAKYQKLRQAYNTAQKLNHDKSCCIIENRAGRVKIRTMDEVISYLGL